MGGQSLRVLFLTKYGRNGASSRYRSLQYLPWLERENIQATVDPLFDEAYLEGLYGGGSISPWHVLRRVMHRVVVLAAAKRFDLVFLEKEVLPYLPALPELWLRLIGVPYAADYDDALFHQYDQHPSRWVRRLLKGKIGAVMKGAAVVVAGNAYLADYAQRVGARRVEIIPTVVDLAFYPPGGRGPRGEGPMVIGWIGSPSTSRYLERVAPALAEVCRKHKAQVRIVGASPVDLPRVPLTRVPWVEADEVNEVQRFDIGIMPLPDEPWERGKCGFKLIQYMACGVPVVASPVGANKDIVEPGVDGFLADSCAQWVDALTALLADAGLRHRMGEAGRRKVEQQYAVQVAAPRLAGILASVVGRR